MSTVLWILAAYLGVHVAIVGMLTVVNLTERGVRPRPSREGIACFAREVAAWAGILPMLAVGPWEGFPERSPEPPEGTDSVEVPVILVPGYAFNRGTLLALSVYLRRRGWRWVWAVNNRPWSSPVDGFVDRLAERVDDMLLASKAPQVDLVGHSMGGAIAAAYVVKHGAAGKVRRIVTLGTPWSGTKLHIWGNRRQARDLAPDSQILARAREVTVPVVGIWSESDGIVAPPSAARPPEGQQEVHLPHVGHVEMCLSARAFRAVAAALRRPEAAA